MKRRSIERSTLITQYEGVVKMLKDIHKGKYKVVGVEDAMVGNDWFLYPNEKDYTLEYGDLSFTIKDASLFDVIDQARIDA